MLKRQLPKIIIINIGLIIFIFGFLEIAARLFSNAIFFGNSKNLFDTSNKNYITNCKSCEAESFGQKIYTNKFGYRVSGKNTIKTQTPKEEIIFIGDSVAFGPGVKFEETFQGLLSYKLSEYNFINKSVIGHSLDQHLKTADLTVKDNKNIKKVYLIYCLNDLSNISNYEIAQISKAYDVEDKWYYKIKKNNFFSFINKQLRNKSILYMYIKGIVTKPQERYFFSDLKNYLIIIDQLNINNLKKISEIFKEQNIKFTVLISPYEYQVRNAKINNNLLIPQKLLIKFFEKNQISYVDTYTEFQKSKFKSSELFLPFDPMHLSVKGHQILFKVIQNDLTNKSNYY